MTKHISYFLLSMLLVGCYREDPEVDKFSGPEKPKILWKVPAMVGSRPSFIRKTHEYDFLVQDSGVIVPYAENGVWGLAKLHIEDGRVLWKYHDGLDFARHLANTWGKVTLLKDREWLVFSHVAGIMVFDLKNKKELFYDNDFSPFGVNSSMAPTFLPALYGDPDGDKRNHTANVYEYVLGDDGVYRVGDMLIPGEKYYKEYENQWLWEYYLWEESGDRYIYLMYEALNNGGIYTIGNPAVHSLYNLTKRQYVYKNIPKSTIYIIDKQGDVLYTYRRLGNAYFGIEAIDVKTGQTLWKWDAPSDGELYTTESEVLFDNKIYFVGVFNLHCIDARTGIRLWKAPFLGNAMDRFRYVNGVLYSAAGVVDASDATTGSLLFKWNPAPGNYFMGAMGVYKPVGKAGKVRFVVHDRAYVYCVEALR